MSEQYRSLNPSIYKKFFIEDNTCVPYKLILNKADNYLRANGWESVESAEEADIAIVGMCAAFHTLEEEALGMVKNAKKKSKEVIAFGCLATISPGPLKKLNADRVIPATAWERLESLVENPVVPFGEVADDNEFRSEEEYRLYDEKKRFVLLQTGCSSRCTYCTHKLGIGKLHSIPPEQIINQVKLVTKRGGKVLVLHGNDTGSYGTDIGTTYPELLREVLKYSPNLHLTQLNADWVYKYRDELFPLDGNKDALLMNKKIKDFQTPIQTNSGRVLELMRRKPVVKLLYPYLKQLREVRKDVFMRTDVMLGYPGSTEEEEQITLEFVAELFDEVAIHGFERFEHTPVEKMIKKGEVEAYSNEEIERRAQNAVEYLKQFPNKILHRGGQVYQTMWDIESPKEELREKLNNQYGEIPVEELMAKMQIQTGKCL